MKVWFFVCWLIGFHFTAHAQTSIFGHKYVWFMEGDTIDNLSDYLEISGSGKFQEHFYDWSGNEIYGEWLWNMDTLILFELPRRCDIDLTFDHITNNSELLEICVDRKLRMGEKIRLSINFIDETLLLNKKSMLLPKGQIIKVNGYNRIVLWTKRWVFNELIDDDITRLSKIDLKKTPKKMLKYDCPTGTIVGEKSIKFKLLKLNDTGFKLIFPQIEDNEILLFKAGN